MIGSVLAGRSIPPCLYPEQILDLSTAAAAEAERPG